MKGNITEQKHLHIFVPKPPQRQVFFVLFFIAFCILQMIKHWMIGRPGNTADLSMGRLAITIVNIR